MADPVAPALTAQEWARPLVTAAGAELEGGKLSLYQNDGDDELGAGERHAMAAMCLHRQPFGFTWADVDALNDGAAEIDGEWTAPQPSAVALRSLADRIAALLPPRDP